MSKITFNIEYAGLQLQVGKNENGEDVTPLKPISDLFGLSWADQHKKIGEKSATCGGDNPPAGSYFSRRLGVCTVQMYCAGSQKTPKTDTCIGDIPYAGSQKRDVLCIKLDRVAAFLMTINPDRVRANGNISGADFLEAKITEWDDALHDYEEIGVAFNMNHAKMQESRMKSDRFIAQIIAIKNKTEPKQDRQLLEQMISTKAKSAGYEYQLDLLDSK